MGNTVRFNGVELPVESVAGKEVLKWERKSDYRPENHPFPKMLYKAFKGSDGVVRCMQTEPRSRHLFISDEQYRAAIQDAEIFTAQCQRTVKNEQEYKVAFGDGWRESAKDAIEAAMHWETVIKGEAAAHQEFLDRRMSEKAKEEKRAGEASTPDMLPEFPEAPLVKIDGRSKAGRAAKAAATA